MQNRKAKTLKRVLLMLVLMIFFAGGIFYAWSAKEAVFDLTEQMDFGERYLEALDYENAVLTYETILEVDPRNVDAYLGLAEAHVGLGNKDEAIKALEIGFEKTKDCRIKVKLTDLIKGRSRSSTSSEDRATEIESTEVQSAEVPLIQNVNEDKDVGNIFGLTYREVLERFGTDHTAPDYYEGGVYIHYQAHDLSMFFENDYQELVDVNFDLDRDYVFLIWYTGDWEVNGHALVGLTEEELERQLNTEIDIKVDEMTGDNYDFLSFPNYSQTIVYFTENGTVSAVRISD